VFFGIRWDESYNRRWTIIKYGTLFYHKSHRVWKCYPIAYWSDLDAWRYIEENNIPLNKAYEKVDRVGCIVCTAYKDWEKDMARLYPGLYRKIAKDLGRLTLDHFVGGE
jgi:3'-phosphoadenosine 5'-phosphosulfate sulfotransferase (PAPS reductase)/FAD synthetase